MQYSGAGRGGDQSQGGGVGKPAGQYYYGGGSSGFCLLFSDLYLLSITAMADYKEKIEEWQKTVRRKARELDEKYAISDLVDQG